MTPLCNGAAAVGAAIALLSSAAAGAEGVMPRAVNCKVIRTVAQLQAISDNPTGNYCLGNDIDASSVANFTPVVLLGRFFGNGHTIRNLTINSTGVVGLFSVFGNGVIQDLRLVNVNITSSGNGAVVGGLVGRVDDTIGGTTISRVHVSGKVQCTGECAAAGGIAGVLLAGQITLSESLSSATVIGPGALANTGYAGGAVGLVNSTTATIRRITAIGSVSCGATMCHVGGLVGVNVGAIERSAATGPVTAEQVANAGGLVGWLATVNGAIRLSHASGPVDGGTAGNAGGLIGRIENGTIEQSYSIGRVSGGGNVGGLAGDFVTAVAIEDTYWDRVTSKQMTSVAGLQLSTSEFRADLPVGFGNAWDITKNKSYPFLNDADIDFTAPLATLVKTKRVYTFLPIDQHDAWEYAGASTGANAASLATAYTMIARAIGITRNVAALKGVKIDTDFWNDANKTTIWQGPVTTYATLGTFAAIAANTPLNNTNVIGAMKTGQLVLLRGTYTKGSGANAKHWLLGTLYTASGNSVGVVVANDPWTGQQAMIDPKTKQVVWPADFPLANFTIDGFQPVTLN